ncbi:hypothetical protein, partial [Niastella populi]|uniref:hypothetical protein n=1 Tax=Niastella populi TaxID=550983 RepID=UPI001A9904ED
DNTGTITLPSTAAILYVFVMVICFMITKLGRLRGTIYQGVTSLVKIYFCNNCLKNCNKKACMK